MNGSSSRRLSALKFSRIFTPLIKASSDPSLVPDRRLLAEHHGRHRACDACRLRLPSQPSELPLNDHAPQLPFESVSVNLFQCQGQQFTVYVDRLTGWPCVARLGHSTTSHAVIIALRRWFPDIGVPAVLMADGDPQFSSRKFAEFCQRWGIDHISSPPPPPPPPHYRQSNGHAEAGVKAMKTLIVKTTTNGNLDTESFARRLLEWQNTPNASGKSPAQLLLGRPLSSPTVASSTAHGRRKQTPQIPCPVNNSRPAPGHPAVSY